MKLYNPFKYLNKNEWLIFISSVVVICFSFLFSTGTNILTLIASLIGVTALIFVSKGDAFGQILTVIFSVFYGIISIQFRYYGEMITYLFMTAPIAIMTVISWIKHPYKNSNEVKVNKLTKKQLILMVILTILTTIIFYFILKKFNTPNLIVSTISIATSFSASYLMLFRSPYYAIAYSLNDIVLIILWILATIESITYISMIFCFVMFLLNDLYGFINWMKIRKRQKTLN